MGPKEKKGEAQHIWKHLVLLRYTAAMATGEEKCSTLKNLAETSFPPLSYTGSDCPI